MSANGVVPDSDGGAGGSGAPNASAVSTEPCLARGRARGNLACAFPLDEARACTTSDPQSCEPICEQWQQGLAEAAAIHYAVELRSSRCWDTDPMLPGKRRCDAVARINGSCYATERSGFYAPTPYDCALSDEEILTLNDRADPGNVP